MIKDSNKGLQFANDMVAMEHDVLLQVFKIAEKYHTDPFKTLDCLANHLLKVNEELKTKIDSQQGGSNHDELIRD